MAGEAATTLYVIAYDVASDRRRTRVHKLLCGFGQWTQFSVFECWLTKKQLLQLRFKLEPLLDPSADHVRLYTLCASCAPSVVTIGGTPPGDPTTIIL